MAASEIYDFLNTATPDYSATVLDISPQPILIEDGEKNEIIFEGEDTSEERVSLSSAPVFYIVFPYNGLTEADAGTLFEYYFNASKANGRMNSFKWQHVDGHQYVVRFDCALKRSYLKAGSVYAYNEIRLKIFGKV